MSEPVPPRWKPSPAAWRALWRAAFDTVTGFLALFVGLWALVFWSSVLRFGWSLR